MGDETTGSPADGAVAQVGKVTNIKPGYGYTIDFCYSRTPDGFAGINILVDDSVLCKDPTDGITYKIMIDDVKISRYIECDMIKVGGTVVVAYEGDIDAKNGNAISKAIDISEGIISEGDVLIPE